MKPVSFNLFGQRLTILPKIIISFLVVHIPIQTLSLMMNHSSVNNLRRKQHPSNSRNRVPPPYDVMTIPKIGGARLAQAQWNRANSALPHAAR